MNLVVDMGNTNITFGLFRKSRIFKNWDVPTKSLKSPAIFKKTFLEETRKKKINLQDIGAIIICSVVPFATKELGRQLKNIFTTKPEVLILGQDIPIPIINKYKSPAQAGKDRLVNALGAVWYYGVPAIIIDFGTAVTIDVVSRNKEYLGGIISPGIGLCLGALHEKTALLPLLNPARPRKLLGRDTKNSMLSGIFYGLAFLVDGFVEAIQKDIKERAIVIATGGNCHLIKPFLRKVDKFDRLLTLKGIVKAYILCKYK